MSQEQKVLERFARDYPAGSIVFREGEPGAEMYVIRSGRVRISKRMGDVDRTLAVLDPGDFFGEMAIVSSRPRSATATVVEPASLLSIDAGTLETMLRGNLEIAVRMIRRLAERLAAADRQIETLLLRTHHGRVASYFLGALERQRLERGTVKAEVEQIALETGCDYAQVNDALWRLSSEGLVAADEEAGGFRVGERAALCAFLERHR